MNAREYHARVTLFCWLSWLACRLNGAPPWDTWTLRLATWILRPVAEEEGE